MVMKIEILTNWWAGHLTFVWDYSSSWASAVFLLQTLNKLGVQVVKI